MPSDLSSEELEVTLEVFRMVARQSSLTRAAFALGLSQRVVSRKIRSLENGLGCRLLVRRLRRIELTDGGKALLLVAAVYSRSSDFAITLHHLDQEGHGRAAFSSGSLEQLFSQSRTCTTARRGDPAETVTA